MTIKLKASDIIFDETLYIRENPNEQHKDDIKDAILSYIKSNNYSIENIIDISSILNNLKIPKIIVFKNKDNGNIYLIDGYHRLNAIKEIFGEDIYFDAELIEDKEYNKPKIIKEMIKHNLHYSLKLGIKDRIKILDLYYSEFIKQNNLEDNIMIYFKCLYDLINNFPELFNITTIKMILNKNTTFEKFISDIIINKYQSNNFNDLKDAVYKEFKNQNLHSLLEINEFKDFVDKAIGMAILKSENTKTLNKEEKQEENNKMQEIDDEEIERYIKNINRNLNSILKTISNIKSVIYIIKIREDNKIKINSKKKEYIKKLYNQCLNELEELSNDEIFFMLIQENQEGVK